MANNNEKVIESSDYSYHSKQMDDDAFFESLPQGYRFKPNDEEIIVNYLQPKVQNRELPRNKIKDIQLYKYNPERLTAAFPPIEENEWYFFTSRDRKYKNGQRPNRAADDGYWKATGADIEIKFQGENVGYKKILVFYEGKPPNDEKKNWIMHEYRLNDHPEQKVDNMMLLDEWVLCKLYKNINKNKRGKKQVKKASGDPQASSSSQTHAHFIDTETNYYQDNLEVQAELMNAADIDGKTGGPFGGTFGNNENEGLGHLVGQNSYEDGYSVPQIEFQGYSPFLAAPGVATFSADASVGTVAYVGAQSEPVTPRVGYDAPRGPSYHTAESWSYDVPWFESYDALDYLFYDIESEPGYNAQRVPGFDAQRGPSYEATGSTSYGIPLNGDARAHAQLAPLNNVPSVSTTPPPPPPPQ